MKRLTTLVALLLFSAAPVTFAQTTVDTTEADSVTLDDVGSETVVIDPFVGGSVNFSLPFDTASFSVQGGADNVLGPLAVRGNANIGLKGGFGIGLDILDYVVVSNEVAPYFGGGVGYNFGASALDLRLVGGVEYFVGPDLAIFAELQPRYAFYLGGGGVDVVDDGDNVDVVDDIDVDAPEADFDGGNFGVNIRVGVNYHFE